MKKLSALMLALVMLLSFAAAEDAVTTINFTEMLPADQLALGTFDTLTEDMPVKVWVPNDTFAVADLSTLPDEFVSDLTIGAFKYLADESKVICFNLLPNDEGEFADLVAALKADTESFRDVDEAIVNGYHSVSYKTPEEDGTITAFATYEIEPEMYLNIMFKTTENEADALFNQFASLIAASVSPVE